MDGQSGIIKYPTCDFKFEFRFVIFRIWRELDAKRTGFRVSRYLA